MIRQFITCKFKIHNPSAHKRQVLDLALEEYTLGYEWLLDWAKNKEVALAENGKYVPRSGRPRYTDKSISRLLPKLSEFPASLHSSAKSAVIQDVAGGLASYFALREKDPNTSFPTCRDTSPAAYDDALDEFALVGGDITDYTESKDCLLRTARGSVMPLYFPRADGASKNRNFSLLWNTKKGQLLAVLYLLPQGHELGKRLEVSHGHLVRLDTGEIFRSRSKCAIIVPLQLGRNGWQEYRFLEPSRAGGASVQSAYLVRNDEAGEYFLHISFAVACPEPYKPGAYLGIDKGILFTAAYGLIDAEGKVIEIGHFDDELRNLQIKHGQERERLAKSGKRITWRHYKRRAYDNILHGLANRLIELAKKHNAQIVVEDMGIQVKGGRVVSRFRKLDKILAYKCKLAGVPMRGVFAAYSSVICHKCGATMDRDDRVVRCPNCWYRGHSDDNAAVNIARRAMYRKSDWEKKGGYRAFHRSFAAVANEAGFGARIDLRQGAVTHPVSGNGCGPGTDQRFVQGRFEALFAVSG